MSSIKITLNHKVMLCEEDESVLDALLRENIDIPYGCRQGTCQSCMVRSLQGTPPAAAQLGLKDVLCHQNYFLACLCYPQHDLVINIGPPVEEFTEATVIAKRMLNAEVMLLTVVCKKPMDFYAGQFVNLKRADGLHRSYSIADNRVQANKLSFHIRRLAGGRFSEWAHQELNVGDTLDISEPQGLCYYLPGNPEQGMLLIGTGSGLAPLAGIIGEALHHGHSGPIHLFHGSREVDGLYWMDEMRKLAVQYPNFHYTPCVSKGDAPEGVGKGRANDVAMSALPSLKGWRIYLCGHPEMVLQSKKQAFLKGAAAQDIYTDAFHIASTTLD